MNLKINNDGNLFTDKELEILVRLAGEKISNLPYTIGTIGSFKQFEKSVSGTPDWYIDRVKSGDIYASHFYDFLRDESDALKCIALLYEFNCVLLRNKKIHAAFSLFHELRHMYQYVYLKEELDKHKELIGDPKDEEYKNQWAEKDADYFAWKTMKENKTTICELFSDNSDWLTEIELSIPHVDLNNELVN